MSLEQGQIRLMKYWIFLSQSEIPFVRDSTEMWLWLPLECQQQVIQGDGIATPAPRGTIFTQVLWTLTRSTSGL